MAGIWAVVQHRDGKLHRGSWEAIAAAQALAAQRGGKAEAVVLGHGVDALAAEVAA
ncbi:MAG: electron transfer flavoprotein subunit alpha/FixB family protein, partial [Thermoanaerobaculia bacterium]